MWGESDAVRGWTNWQKYVPKIVHVAEKCGNFFLPHPWLVPSSGVACIISYTHLSILGLASLFFFSLVCPHLAFSIKFYCCYVCQEHSTSDARTDGGTAHNNAAGDALPRVGMSAERKLSDTAMHGKRSAVNGAGDPQSNIVPPPPPALHRCASVPTGGDSGFSRFRSLSDRRFSQDVAPSPWSCGSSIRELSCMGSNMRAGTCSTPSDVDPGTYSLFTYSLFTMQLTRYKFN